MTEEKEPGQEVRGARGGRATRQRDWTKGSIIGNLWSLSWPVMISSSLNMAGPTIDMIWVGRLGAASIAGVGVAGMAVQLMMGLKQGINTGLRAMIARFWGAGDTSTTNHMAMQGFVVSAIYSILMAIVGIYFAEQIMGLFGLEADVIAQGAAYMRIMFVGAASSSFYLMGEGVMQASGDTQTPMRLTLFVRLFHVVLAPFLIFGWWLFPRFGVSGAAMTNIVSQSLGLVLAMWILFSGRTRIRLTMSHFRFDFNIIWRMVKIGIPASLTTNQWTFANMVLMRLMAPFGTLAVAAHTIAQRAEQVIHMPSGGLGMAAGVLAGQNLGAGQPDRAEKSGWLGLALVEGVMLVGVVAILIWSENIIRIFSSNPGLIEIGSAFLKIAAASYFVLGICSVFFSCLNHVGDTLPPLLIILPSVWLVEMPLAYFLPKVTNLGVYGVRWSIVASLAVASVAYAIYFRMGRWKQKRV